MKIMKAPELLNREVFRESVFRRDGFKCIVCGSPAQDAHHIMERRLFDTGGYYLDNGVSLCGGCHIKAEQTVISTQFLREKAGITKGILPEHLYPDYSYTKWGDIENANGTRYKGELFFDESVQKVLKSGGVLSLYSDRIKYPRTYHLPCSPGRTDDDKVLKDYSNFIGNEVVATVKMDGENTTAYWDGYIHARSLDSQNHASRNWVKNFLSKRIYELPTGYRICGENLYAKHAIHYQNLESYFYLFSIWNEKNECISRDDTIEWAELLDLTIVPNLYWGPFNQETIENLYNNPIGEDENECEGFVLRNTNKFAYGEFRRNVGKFVRENHVQENKHWIKTAIIPNKLAETK